MEDPPVVYEGTGSSASCRGISNAEDGSAGESVQTLLEKGGIEVIPVGLSTTTGLQSGEMLLSWAADSRPRDIRAQFQCVYSLLGRRKR